MVYDEDDYVPKKSKKNVGTRDRIIRAILATTIGMTMLYFSPLILLFSTFFIMSVFLLISSLTGICYVYDLLEISTTNKNED